MSDPMQRWVDVYEEESAGLIRFASMLVGASAAEDVVSQAMIRVLDGPNLTALPADQLTAYLFKTVSNTAKNHLRSGSRRSHREKRVATPDVAPPAGSPVDPNVIRAMNVLSTQQRAVIFLTYWSDLTVSDVAAYLGVSTGTVKRQLARGRAKLGKALS